MAIPPIDDVARHFASSRHRYEEFATRLHLLVVDLLRQEGLSTIQVEFRVKTVESFTEKISRKKYDTPLLQMTDLVGLRIVGYYLEDIERIGELIAREFDVHQEDSVKKASELDIDRFGYRSDHYIVSIGESRKQLVEWAEYSTMKAEIQVRTALQHAWAAVDHKLNYKNLDDIPKELQRRLIRLSALFELADEEFSAIRERRLELLSERSHDLATGNLTAKIDDISVHAYLKSIEPALRVGSDNLLTKIGDTPKASTRALLSAAQGFNIRTIGDLENEIGDDWDEINRKLTVLDKHIKDSGEKGIFSVSMAVLSLLMLQAHMSGDVVADNTPFGKAIIGAAAEISLDEDG